MRTPLLLSPCPFAPALPPSPPLLTQPLCLAGPLCLDHRAGQSTPASSILPHYLSANSPADSLHLLLGSQPPSRCHPANHKATAERKAPARPPAAPSASQKQGQSLSAFPNATDAEGPERGQKGLGLGEVSPVEELTDTTRSHSVPSLLPPRPITGSSPTSHCVIPTPTPQ